MQGEAGVPRHGFCSPLADDFAKNVDDVSVCTNMSRTVLPDTTAD